jgi:hypothetical protein
MSSPASSSSWQVRIQGDELGLRGPGASVVIYQSKPGVAGLLGVGVVYNLELADLDGNEVHVARDPRFQLRRSAGRGTSGRPRRGHRGGPV